MGDVTVLHQVPSTITLYKLDGEKFTTLGSNLGCAVVGSAVSLTYQLLCYGEGVPSTVTATISPTNTIQYSTAQGQLYASFTADDGMTYSIAFRNDSDAVNLSVHLGLAFYGSKARPPDTVTTYDLITGSGKNVDQNDTVGIVATGWIVSNNEKNLPVTGTVYQQLGTLDNLFKAKVGDGTVSIGLSQGIRGMKKESKRVLVIPGAFQGGAGGQTLVYIVHVVKVKWDTSPPQPPKPPVPNGVSAADFADFEEFKRMKAAQLVQQGATAALAAPPGSMPPTQPQQPYGSPYGQPPQAVQPLQSNIYQQPQQQPNPYQQQTLPYQQPQIVPPQPQVIVQPQPVVQTVNVPVLTAAEIGAVQAALSEHASQHQTSLQQLQMHFQQQHINLSSSVDTIIARLSSTGTKIENLEGHRLFKENQGSMSGVAITASISKLVNDNDTFRAEVNEKDEKIVELKKKVEELRKKAESYATESAGILEEKKSAVNQVAETKAELEREIARLKETLQRAYNERDDAQRHLHTVKKLHDLSEEELRRTKQRLDGLDTSTQADSERINDLQQTIREEKTKNKEVSQKANALRDELAEEKEAHLRTQQQLDERRKKNEAERTHYTELIEQERRTAAEELRRVREEMKESSGVKERHWEEEKAHLTETVAERARIEGMKQGRDEANAVSSVTIANMQTQLDNAATEIAGLQERISGLQALLEAKARESAQFQEQTQEEKAALNAEREATLEEARTTKAEAERVREEADKEIKETLEASQQRVKSIMSTVYFKFSKSMREHRKLKSGRHGIRREEAIDRLLAIIKAQTLRGLEGTSASEDESDDEEEDDDEDEGYRSTSPMPYSPAPPSHTAGPTPATPRELLEKTVITPRHSDSIARFAPDVTPEPTVLAVPSSERETPMTLPHPATTTFDDLEEEEEEVASPLQPREVIITSTHIGPELDDTDEEVKEAPIPVKEEEDTPAQTLADPLTVTEEEPAAAVPLTPATEAEEEEPVSAPVVVETPAPPKKKSYFDSDSEDEKESEPMSDPVVVEQPLAEPAVEEKRSATPELPAPNKAPTPEPEVEAEPVVVEQPVEQVIAVPPSSPSPPPAAGTKKGLFDSDDEDEPPRKAAPEPEPVAAVAAAAPKKKGLFDSDDEDEDDGIMNAIGAKKEESKNMFDSDDEDPFG